MTDTALTDISTALAAIQADGGGVVHVTTVMHAQGAGMLEAALSGEQRPLLVAQAVGNALRHIADRRNDPDTATPCGCCARPLLTDVRFGFAVVTPAVDAPQHSLALAICTSCAATREELETKAREAVGELWPRTRTIAVTHSSGGRA